MHRCTEVYRAATEQPHKSLHPCHLFNAAALIQLLLSLAYMAMFGGSPATPGIMLAKIY